MNIPQFDLKTGRNRLLQLVRERAYREGPAFKLASGKESNFYVNCKEITLESEGLWLLSHLIVETLRPRGITAIGGLTLGADPIAAGAAVAAHQAGYALRPFIVRKETKGHGTQKLVEGTISPKDKICVVEDVVTTGGSTKKALEAVEAAGCQAAVILTIVDREDPDADWLRRDPRFVPLFRLSEIRKT